MSPTKFLESKLPNHPNPDGFNLFINDNPYSIKQLMSEYNRIQSIELLTWITGGNEEYAEEFIKTKQ